MNLKAALRAVLLPMTLLGSQAASAALLNGNVVEYQYLWPKITSPYPNADNGNKLVGPGIEVANIVDDFGTLDISDTNLLIDFNMDQGLGNASNVDFFSGFRITDVFGTIPAFAGVSVNQATNLTGFNISRVTFDADHIWVSLRGTNFRSNTIVSLDIIAVPEPTTANGIVVIGMQILVHRRRSLTTHKRS